MAEGPGTRSLERSSYLAEGVPDYDISNVDRWLGPHYTAIVGRIAGLTGYGDLSKLPAAEKPRNQAVLKAQVHKEAVVTQETSLITDELRQSIGVESEPQVVVIERGAILQFGNAIEDPNPLWTDEAKARPTRYGGLIAPPTFFRSLMAISSAGLPPRMLHAGTEWEYLEPVRAGDTITVTDKIASAQERDLRVGRSLFIITEISYKNQFGQLVATQKDTMIYY